MKPSSLSYPVCWQHSNAESSQLSFLNAWWGLCSRHRGLAGGLELRPVAAVVAVAEGRRDADLGVAWAAGGLLVVACLLENDGEALRRRRVLHVPLPELWQRPALVLHI
uniref:Uncharacterized protein n=1 Tax=Leersia perrieri TaxID=77586 RepID=A0A0D9W9M2_9ORYZ